MFIIGFLVVTRFLLLVLTRATILVITRISISHGKLVEGAKTLSRAVSGYLRTSLGFPSLLKPVLQTNTRSKLELGLFTFALDLGLCFGFGFGFGTYSSEVRTSFHFGNPTRGL